MRRLKILKKAQLDLNNIARYTYGQWGYSQSVVYIEKLINELSLLIAFPYSGKSIEGTKYRYFQLNKTLHYTIYITDSENIYIAAFLHINEDLGSTLKDLDL